MRAAGYFRIFISLIFVATTPLAAAKPIDLAFSPFSLAVAEMAANEPKIADFYKSIDYQPVWTGNGALFEKRRQALIEAIEMSGSHGLPTEQYRQNLNADPLTHVETVRDLGRIEVAFTQVFDALTHDLQYGVLDPRKVNPDNKRIRPESMLKSRIDAFMRASPRHYFQSLVPSSSEYAGLLKEKWRLEALLSRGGWGVPVRAGSLAPGDRGADVVALRDRLTAMGYLRATPVQNYDAAITQAVRAFQADHGLTQDGVAGPGTLRAINTPIETRLKSVIVAMERERWMNSERQPNHVLVNITDFSVRIIQNDRVTFETRSVVGKNEDGRRTPEFSDEIEYMVINPTWNVPRSIVVKEYLPRLKRNRNAAGHLDLYDRRGRKISRGAINFGQYSAKTFPYAMKQKPSARNALGLVKFMFPNQYNIYLHDTPSKGLFDRETRAFSHGCVRLQKPFDFAYALLSVQESDPKGVFHRHLATGAESVVRLEHPVPVHLIYRTAFTSVRGGMEYRDDVYGRDARIWQALSRAGVHLPGAEG